MRVIWSESNTKNEITHEEDVRIATIYSQKQYDFFFLNELKT